MLPNPTRGILLAACMALICTTALADNEGLAELDKATELQLQTESLQDLEEVVQLCEQALAKGLDEGNSQFAKQLIVSSLWQHASRLTAGIIERGRPGRGWQRSRTQAMEDLEKLLKHDEKFADAYVLIANLNRLPGGDPERAFEALEKAIKLHKEARETDKLVETLLLRAGLRTDPEDSLADIAEALEAKPTSVDALRLRAVIRIGRGELEQALGDFRKLLEQNPENASVYEAIAETHVALEQYDKAIENLTEAARLTPDSPRYLIMRARVYETQENHEQALADLSKALEIDPESAEALMARASLHYLSENLEAARADVKRLLQATPDSPQGVLLESMIAASDGDFATAISSLQRILRSDPTNVELRLQLAQLYVADQRPRKAIQLLTQVLRDDEQNWRAMRARGDALLSVTKHAEAIEDYNRALELQPDDDGVLNNLAWVLSTSPNDDLRDGTRAIKLATRACEVTNYEKPHILSTLAAAYAESGDFENAIKWSSKAVELGETDLKEQIDQLKDELDHYKQNKPFRELQDVQEKPDLPERVLET